MNSTDIGFVVFDRNDRVSWFDLIDTDFVITEMIGY